MKNPDETVCLCFHVSQRKLINHIRINQPKVVSQLSDCGGAGTGCGWCVPYLNRIFQQAVNSDLELAELEEVVPEDYASQRQDYIKAGKKRKPDQI